VGKVVGGDGWVGMGGWDWLEGGWGWVGGDRVWIGTLGQEGNTFGFGVGWGWVGGWDGWVVVGMGGSGWGIVSKISTFQTIVRDTKRFF
jgi:hypothetical protein